ncbi:hypothetical protein VTJ04DRAFT_7643 [Mycothermus thermophilus]|uniref:uncharacterized protein n=1 Tax=Humicola insolens TaxID=85995 RepID=UPI0037437B92
MATRCERTAKRRGELDVPQAKFHYFLQLPAELRIKIYNLLLLQESPILVTQAIYFPIWERGKAPCIELFYVNKGVGAEARYQFYFINTFSFWEGTNLSAWKEVATRFIDWIESIGENALAIRSVKYVVDANFTLVPTTLPLFRKIGQCFPNLNRLLILYGRIMDGEQGLIVLHNYIKEILMTKFKGVRDVQFG